MLNLLLLAGKFLFLLVLYLFIFLVVRTAVRDMRRAGQHPARTPSPAVQAGAEAGVWTLAVEASPELRPGEVYSLGGVPLVLGRSASADLQLRDTFVSSHHARFSVTSEGLLLEDLQSTNGTQVNGEEVARAWLEPGDRVAVGDTVFRVGAA